MEFKRAFNLIELIVILLVVIILVVIALPRIGSMRSAAALSKNSQNVALLVEDLSKFELEGRSLTNVSSLDAVTSQLIAANVLTSAEGFSDRQISMYWRPDPAVSTVNGEYNTNGVEGTLYFHPTNLP